MRNLKFFAFLSVLFIIVYTTSFTCLASTKVAAQPITVKPILPSNQKTGVTGYFNLSVNSGDSQIIYMQITNHKMESVDVTLVSANAYTRPEGGIFYDKVSSPETILLDSSFALSEYIFTDPSITISSNETIKVPIKITVPDIKSGTILGGILISETADTGKAANEDTKAGEAKFKLKTKTVYAVAIQLDLPNTPTSAFSFGKAGFTSSGAKIFIEMRNDAPMIQRDISGTYTVTKKGGEKLFGGKIVPMIMAPKTQINYSFPWSGTLESGNYILSIAASVAGGDVTIDRSFTIEEKEIEEYSQKTNQLIVKTKSYTLYFIMISATIAFGALIYYIVRRKRIKRTSKRLSADKPKHLR